MQVPVEGTLLFEEQKMIIVNNETGKGKSELLEKSGDKKLTMGDLSYLSPDSKEKKQQHQKKRRKSDLQNEAEN